MKKSFGAKKLNGVGKYLGQVFKMGKEI